MPRETARRRHPEAQRSHQLGEGSRAQHGEFLMRYAPDPSLRLKSGYARDDAFRVVPR